MLDILITAANQNASFLSWERFIANKARHGILGFKSLLLAFPWGTHGVRYRTVSGITPETWTVGLMRKSRKCNKEEKKKKKDARIYSRG